jgi:hypothetical protein
MEAKLMEQRLIIKIDLAEIEGEGEFSCPSCGNNISPDDISEESYEIKEIKTRKDGSLEGILILCHRCGNNIDIKGFGLLQEISM